MIAGRLEPSAYVTDGARLYRVISTLRWPPADSFAVLEDCRTLDMVACSPDELLAMGLRVVRGQKAPICADINRAGGLSGSPECG